MTAAERECLIIEHLSLIHYVAHRIATGLPASVEIDDLVHAGVIGLLDAADKYDPDRGVKFKTYAELRVRGAILDSLRELDWAPRSLRRKGRELQRASSTLEQKLNRPATDEELSETLGKSLDTLHALLDQLNATAIGSFDVALDDASENSAIHDVADDRSNDPHKSFATIELTRALAAAIDALPDSERRVLSLYYYEEMTMKEIGRTLGLHESRISQLHSKATVRLRSRLRNTIPTNEDAINAMETLAR